MQQGPRKLRPAASRATAADRLIALIEAAVRIPRPAAKSAACPSRYQTKPRPQVPSGDISDRESSSDWRAYLDDSCSQHCWRSSGPTAQHGHAPAAIDIHGAAIRALCGAPSATPAPPRPCPNAIRCSLEPSRQTPAPHWCDDSVRARAAPDSDDADGQHLAGVVSKSRPDRHGYRRTRQRAFQPAIFSGD